MTGKHVEEVARGGPPQRRTGLAVGLAVLTGLLCVAVLVLSGQRRAAVQARAILSETADALQMYGRVGTEVIRPEYVQPNGSVELVPPLHWQLPAEYRLMVSGPNEADGVQFIAAKASTTQGITAEYWLTADGQWQTRVGGVLEELDLDLDLPSDMGDRGIVEYLLGFNADGLRDQIARVREPVRKAEYYQRGLWMRHRCLVNLHNPRPFRIGDTSGYVQEATVEDPHVFAIVMIGNWVAAEMHVYYAGRLDQPWSVDDLNAAWPSLVAGVRRPRLPTAN